MQDCNFPNARFRGKCASIFPCSRNFNANESLVCLLQRRYEGYGITFTLYNIRLPLSHVIVLRGFYSLSLPLLSQWKRRNACANRKIIIVTPENDRFRAPPAKSQWFSYDRPMNGGRDLVEDMCLLSIRHPSGNIRQSFVICRRIVHGVPCLGKQRYIRCEVKKKGSEKWVFSFCESCDAIHASYFIQVFDSRYLPLRSMELSSKDFDFNRNFTIITKYGLHPRKLLTNER